MKFFGIDTSLTGTGFAALEVFDDGSMSSVLTVISPPKGLKGMARLRWVQNQVKEFLIADATNWSGGAIEGYAMGARGRGVTEIFGLGAIIRLLLYNLQLCKVQDVPPTLLKKFMTKKGQAKKIEMILAVNKYFGLELIDDNQADALALALFAAAKSNWEEMKLTQVQIECLGKSTLLK